MAEINPPISTLIIGLGGSGALTIYHVKQQLFEMYNNRVPETVGLLVLDTAKEPLSQFSVAGDRREEGMGFGVIEFGAREKGHLGGDAHDMLQRAAKGDKAQVGYLSSWLQADYYLKTLTEANYKLEDGAGMYRQLGRLALFRDVAAPSDSQFYNRVREKIDTISGSSTDTRSLAVFIVGSLAGGTGAGLFIDTAYLVRAIAGNRDVQLRGFFYLPEAFEATLNPNQLQSAKARAMGALRELSRFLMLESWDIGYPFTYHPPESSARPDIWKSTLNVKLYDFAYLIDGQRSRKTLAKTPLSRGVTPSVADAILSFIDSHTGEYLRAYNVNISQQAAEKRNREGYRPYIGTLGTYTIMLPIRQMVDGWAFQLALDALDILLVPDRRDESTELPLSLENRANRERTHSAADEARVLLTSGNDIIDPRDPNRRIRPADTWRHIYNFYEQRNEAETPLVNRLGMLGLADWLNYFMPGADDSDAAVQRAKRDTQRVLSTTVATEVPTSDEMNPKEDPQVGARRIANATHQLFDKQLGVLKSGGQREGGFYRDALDRFVDVQVNRFRDGLETYIVGQLIGQDDRDAERARAGKLGWTISVLRELDTILTSVGELMELVRTRNVGDRNPRAQAVRNWNSAETEMNDRREDTGRFLGFVGTSPAVQAQHNYRNTAEYALEMYRAEIAREALTEVIRQMRDFAQSAINSLANWIEVLALDTHSLYARAHSGKQQVILQRNQAADIPCRRVIRDDEWEQARYQTYLERSDARQTALAGFQWDATTELDERGGSRLRIRLSLRREGGGQQPDIVSELDDNRNSMTGKWSDDNFQALMSFCREVFSEALDRESVLNYLATRQYAGQSDELANELFHNSGTLLQTERSAVGQPVPANYLLAHQDPDRPEESQFLREAMNHLKAEYGVAVDDETLARLQNADDRFRLTLVNMTELIPLPRIGCYEDHLGVYMRANTTDRTTYHVFPAEVNSVVYEDQLVSQLHQGKRIIQDRIAVLLEDKDLFKEFLTLMAHDIILSARDELAHGREQVTRYAYYLSLIPNIREARFGDDNVWWLTESSPEPSLLDAMTSYIYLKRDVGYETYVTDYSFPIDYDAVRAHLNQVRERETENRMEDYNLASHDDDMYTWLEKFVEKLRKQFEAQGDEDFDAFLSRHEDYRDMARTIVEHDVLKEFVRELELELPGMNKRLEQFRTGADEHGQTVDRRQQQALQELFDLYSMAIVVLEQEIEAKRKDIAKKAGMMTSLGRIGST